MKRIGELENEINAEKSSTNLQKAKGWLELKKDEIIERYGDAEKFALAFNPSVQMMCAMNVERALTGNAPTVRQLLHAYPVGQVEVWMMAQIHNMNEYVGVKSKMDKYQMIELRRVLITKCRCLKASEILLFFYMLKGGDFGSFYGTVDPQKVGVYLNEFIKWRQLKLVRIHQMQEQREHDRRHEEWKRYAITREEYDRRQEEQKRLELVQAKLHSNQKKPELERQEPQCDEEKPELERQEPQCDEEKPELDDSESNVPSTT